MPKPTYAEQIYKNQHGMIEMLGGTWKDEGGVLTGIWNGLTVTRMQVVDAKNVRCELLLTASAAAAIGPDRARFYGGASEAAFVSIVTGRDPRLALQANFGTASGAAVRDIKDGGRAAAKGAAERVAALLGGASPAVPRRKSLVSDGASYVVVRKSALKTWKALTAKETRGPDAAFLLTRGKTHALVLGTPDLLYAFPTKDGALLVRVVSFDADDDEVLARHVAAIRKSGFHEIEGTLETDGALAVLSAADAGKDAETLSIDLPAGEYAVSHATVMPDDTTELLVVRLARSRT